MRFTVIIKYRLRNIAERVANGKADSAIFHTPHIGIDTAAQVCNGNTQRWISIELHI